MPTRECLSLALGEQMHITTLILAKQMETGWLMAQARGAEPLHTNPPSRESAMVVAQRFVAEKGGPNRRYSLVTDQIGLKQLVTLKGDKSLGGMYRSIQEANQQVMARNRLKKYGIKVPEFYGFVYAYDAENNEWYAYGVMEHIQGQTFSATSLYHFGIDFYDVVRRPLETLCVEAGAWHSDMHAGNVMMCRGHLVIIDWEGDGVGPRHIKRNGMHVSRFGRIARRVAA